jgi:hypothetical protein
MSGLERMLAAPAAVLAAERSTAVAAGLGHDRPAPAWELAKEAFAAYSVGLVGSIGPVVAALRPAAHLAERRMIRRRRGGPGCISFHEDPYVSCEE